MLSQVTEQNFCPLLASAKVDGWIASAKSSAAEVSGSHSGSTDQSSRLFINKIKF